MALTTGTTDTTMLVTPSAAPYGGGNGLFGGGDSWLGILFLIALCNGGFGFGGFGGGYGAMMGMGMADGGFGLYPWLNNSEHISDGFRDQQLSTQVGNIQNSITSGFGDVQLGIAGVNQNICQTGSGITNALNAGFANTNLGLCQGFNGVNNSIFGAQTAITQQLSNNEIANLNRSFAEQTANTQGFTSVQSQLAQNGYNDAIGTADLKYTIAKENCDDRYQAAQNTRDIIDSNTRNTQAILDKLCALELDTVKSQLAQAQRDNVGLQNQLNMANLAASQTAQTAELRTSQATVANQLVSELRSCPIPSQPVYGNQPIFTCGQQSVNAGCGCTGSF